jgi:hypothetical protein
MCISWTNKEFEIISSLYNHEDSFLPFSGNSFSTLGLYC